MVVVPGAKPDTMPEDTSIEATLVSTLVQMPPVVELEKRRVPNSQTVNGPLVEIGAGSAFTVTIRVLVVVPTT